MLTIRMEHVEVFKQHKVKLFENRMIKNLYTYFSHDCAELGEAQIRNIIRQGIDRAKTYDIRIEKDVSRFTNLMMTFGTEFDKDPKLSWVKGILSEKKFGPRTSRMDTLYKEAEKKILLHVKSISGDRRT